MMNRLVALVGVAIFGVLGVPAAASATGPNGVEVTANKTPPFPVGSKVKFTVTGCAKKEKIRWELWTNPPGVAPVTTQTSNSNGSGKDDWHINIPGPPGSYFVRATCLDTGQYDDFNLTTVPASYPPGRPGPGLPEADGTWVPGVGGTFSASCHPPAAWIRFGVYPLHTVNEVRSFTIWDNDQLDLNPAVGTVSLFIPAWNNGGMYYVLYQCGPPAEIVGSGGSVGSGSGSVGSESGSTGSSTGSGAKGGKVPVSGSDVEPILRAATVLGAVGVGFVLVARRRRTATA